MPRNRGEFKARILIDESGLTEVDVWDDELSPRDLNKLPVREWVKEHFDASISSDDLHNMFGLPDEGNYEVVMAGYIEGRMFGLPGEEEWDEEITVTSFKYQKLPEEWYEGIDDPIIVE